MKTYAECQEAVERQLKQVTVPYDSASSVDRLAFVVGFLKRTVIDLQFENEQLRSKRNEAEMHQLHDVLSGNKK